MYITFSQQSSNILTSFFFIFQAETVPASLPSPLPLLSPGGASPSGTWQGPPSALRQGALGRGLGPLIGSQSWCRLLQADRQRSADAVQVCRCSTSTLGPPPPGLSQSPPPPPPPPVSLPACLSALWFMRKQKSGQDWNKQIGFYLNCRKNFKRTPGHVNKSFHEDCVNLAHVMFCYVRHRDVSNTLMLLASQIKKKKRSVSRQCYSSTVKHIFRPSKCPDYKWTSTSTVQSL